MVKGLLSKVELHFAEGKNEVLSPGGSISRNPEKTAPGRDEEGAGIQRSFAAKGR